MILYPLTDVIDSFRIVILHVMITHAGEKRFLRFMVISFFRWWEGSEDMVMYFVFLPRRRIFMLLFSSGKRERRRERRKW